MSSKAFFAGACSHKLKSVESRVSNKQEMIFWCPVTNQECHASNLAIGNSALNFFRVGTGL